MNVWGQLSQKNLAILFLLALYAPGLIIVPEATSEIGKSPLLPLSDFEHSLPIAVEVVGLLGDKVLLSRLQLLGDGGKVRLSRLQLLGDGAKVLLSLQLLGDSAKVLLSLQLLGDSVTVLLSPQARDTHVPAGNDDK
jgi:hypothetical protein